jgi:hypothetical protein
MRRPTLNEHMACAALAVIAGAALTSCAVPDPSPPAFQRTTEAAQRTPYGAWIVVRLEGGGVVSGELLALGERSIYVGQGELLHELPTRDIAHARVSLYRAGTAGMRGYVTLGTLTTLSHGLLLIFSAPVWSVGGSLIVRGQSSAGHASYGYRSWWRKGEHPPRGLARYARFPQGLPPGYGQPPPPPPRPPVGTEGGLCYGSGRCEAPLLCEADRCVRPAEPPGEEPVP